jgi:hypothetical protein
MSDLTRSYRRELGAQIAMTEDHWKLFLLQGAGLDEAVGEIDKWLKIVEE